MTRRIELSSLPTRVDVTDWLDEELPVALGHLWAGVPARVGSAGLLDGYPSVASGDGLGGAEDGRVLSVVTDDDECGDELVGAIGISVGFRL